jgi:hypothetical protein
VTDTGASLPVGCAIISQIIKQDCYVLVSAILGRADDGVWLVFKVVADALIVCRTIDMEMGSETEKCD